MTWGASKPQPNEGVRHLGSAPICSSDSVDSRSELNCGEAPSDKLAELSATVTRLGELLAEMGPRQLPETSPLSHVTGRQANELLPMLLTVSDQLEGYLSIFASIIDEEGLWQLAGTKACVDYLMSKHDLCYGRAIGMTELGNALRNHMPKVAIELCAGRLRLDNAKLMSKTMTNTEARIAALGHDRASDSHEASGHSGLDPNAGAATDPDTHTGDLFDSTDASGPDISDPKAGLANSTDSSADGAIGQTKSSPGPDTGEHALLRNALRMPPSQFQHVVDGAAHRADRAADEAAGQDAEDRVYAEITPWRGGYKLTGFLTIEGGLLLKTALKSIIGRPAKDDMRTKAQRQGQALQDLARIDLDHALHAKNTKNRPHINVAVTYDMLKALAARHGASHEIPPTGDLDPARWTDTRVPLPDTLFERLACDSAIARIIFGPDSQILNAGDSIRIASPAQRRAVIARDSHCIYPTCTAPPGICEVHHLDEWTADGGPTNIGNLALVCWHHHKLIHARRLRITRDGPDWSVLRRDGTSFYQPRC